MPELLYYAINSYYFETKRLFIPHRYGNGRSYVAKPAGYRFAGIA